MTDATLNERVAPSNIQIAKKAFLKNLPAILMLWLPTLVVIIYYYFFAADIYESEARFLVHTPNKQQLSGFSGIIESAGLLPPTQENLFAVHDYMTSRDAIEKLSTSLNLEDMYHKRNGDPIAGYPNFLSSKSKEDFYKYFNDQIEVTYDASTGITTLKVRAFRANDAFDIASLLLLEGEKLINRLNERSRSNAIADAKKDLELAENKVAEIQLRMLDYRNKESVLDPKSASEAYVESISKLRTELILSRARLSEIQQSSPNSPMIPSLKGRIRAIEKQYENEKSKLTGSNTSLAPKVGKYEELVLRQEFAAKQLASAVLSLENARAEARRQQIYLDRVVEPNIPDKAIYPEKFKNSFTFFIAFFLVFSICRLMLIGLREHSQR